MTTKDQHRYLKPIDIKRMARVPYATVLRWIEAGHPRAGKLAAVDFSERGKRRSYRVRPEDWEEFQQKLSTPAQTRRQPVPAPPRPRSKAESPFTH